MRLQMAGIMSCALAAGCAEPDVPLSIKFVAEYAGTPASCADDTPVRMSDLRFYVSGFRFRDAAGAWQRITLDDDDRWQQPDLALVDLEDGTGSCMNGTADTNDRVTGSVPAGGMRGLEFTLGVPFERNHGDPLRAAPPLGDPAMHWHWRGGYKFLRAGVQTDGDGFWIHLGSTGCRGTIGNITHCDAPNRVTVRLDDFEPGDDVVIDLAALVAGGALDDGVATDCASGPGEELCAASFRALGLDHASGRADGVQQLFAARAGR